MDTQAETPPLSVVAASSEAATKAPLAGTALPAVQPPTPTGIAPGGLSAPTTESVTSRGAQAGTAPADQRAALPRGMELSPGEEAEPRADPGETRFAPQTAPQLLDGQLVDLQVLDGLLHQILYRLTDLGGDGSEGEGPQNAIAWAVLGSAVLAGLETGRRWRRRRTAPLTAAADWLGWIDLDGPSPETVL